MSFAGVTVVADGKLLEPSAESAIYSGSASSGGWWYHLLVVQGFSRVKDMRNGSGIHGKSFIAGGCRWSVWFYPNGLLKNDSGFVSVYLVLDQKVAQPVKMHQRFSFVDEVDKQQHVCIAQGKPLTPATKITIFSLWGKPHFMRLEDLAKSEHLKDDCFTIRCDFIIPEAAAAPLIEVPPSNISKHLNNLFVTMVGTDVTFEVGRETFTAHRCVLAARSPVFMAQLFGAMKEGTTAGHVIQIQDVEPDVFKALLGFIYTDSIPKMEVKVGEAEEGGAEIMWLQNLLAAADRYDLRRLKSMCEKRLSERIDVGSVTAILGLAAQRHCHGLKEACLEFLKVQSATDLRQVMATSEWEHVAVTNISVVNEFIAKLASKV